MKKFIAAFNGLKLSETNVHYAVFLAKQCNAHLVGVFLEDFTLHSYSVADITSYEGESFDSHMKTLNEKDSVERDESISEFERACRHASLNYSIHRDRNIALQDLVHESIYADLLIINVAETLTRYEESVPSRFMRNLLNDVQCPVFITPPVYRPFDKIVMLYDGEPSSVHAVRTFSYLFDALRHIETEVVTAKNADQSLHLPNKKLIKEFMKRHYPDAEYILLKGYAEDEIIRYLQHVKGDPLIVAGAYRRGSVSRLFRRSMADYLMQHLKMPLFIAHNKS